MKKKAIIIVFASLCTMGMGSSAMAMAEMNIANPSVRGITSTRIVTSLPASFMQVQVQVVVPVHHYHHRRHYLRVAPVQRVYIGRDHDEHRDKHGDRHDDKHGDKHDDNHDRH